MEALSALGAAVKLIQELWFTYSEDKRAEIEATAVKHLAELTAARDSALKAFAEGDKEIADAMAEATKKHPDDEPLP